MVGDTLVTRTSEMFLWSVIVTFMSEVKSEYQNL